MPNQPRILQLFEAAGYQAAVVALALVDEAVRDMAGLFESNALDPAFARRYRNKFRPGWQSAYPHARSVILLAVPAPMLLLRFAVHGAVREGIIPPGYAHTDLENSVMQTVKAAFADTDSSFAWLEGVPMKLLAVHSGLCRYGRSNITFCEGLGSFIELYGIVTDMELPVPALHAPRETRMPECDNCKACTNACPTGSIDPDTRIIHAERCLTYLNENQNEFPSWLEPSAHHTLVGCVKCQRTCPKNRGHLTIRTVTDAFDEEDIDAIFAGGEFAELPEKTRIALHAYNLDEYWPQLSRNLRALLPDQAPVPAV